MWLIGGYNETYTNDVWQSIDGSNWINITASTSFKKRFHHEVIVFKNRMWLIGGFFNGENTNDIWHSSDGTIWTLATNSAAFSKRRCFQVVVYNDKMWLIGGYDGAFKNDVWQSHVTNRYTDPRIFGNLTPQLIIA
jgi:hypothetical protein